MATSMAMERPSQEMASDRNENGPERRELIALPRNLGTSRILYGNPSMQPSFTLPNWKRTPSTIGKPWCRGLSTAPTRRKKQNEPAHDPYPGALIAACNLCTRRMPTTRTGDNTDFEILEIIIQKASRSAVLIWRGMPFVFASLRSARRILDDADSN